MRVTRIHVDDANWPWIEQLLRPAIACDRGKTVAGVRQQLLDGSAGLASLHVPYGAALIVVETVREEGIKALWINYFAGRVRGGPRAWIRTIREGLRHFETKAKRYGCSEVRLGGRNWAPILPDYEPFDPDFPNRIRKVLV